MQLTEWVQTPTVSVTFTGNPIGVTQLVTVVTMAPVGAIDVDTVLAAGSG